MESGPTLYRMIPMLAGLKLSSLTCKCVFYRPELNPKRDPTGLKALKGNMSTDRAQRVDEKNGVICLVIVLTPTVIFFKMSRIAIFLYFLLITSKKLLTVRETYLK